MVTVVNQLPKPPNSALNALATTVYSATASTTGPFSSTEPRRVPNSLDGAPSTKISVAPCTAELTRPDHDSAGSPLPRLPLPEVLPGRKRKLSVMLRFSPKTIIGRSSMNLDERLLGFAVADTSNSGDSPVTVTVSLTAPICSVTSTARLLCADTRIGSLAIVRKPSFCTTSRYDP